MQESRVQAQDAAARARPGASAPDQPSAAPGSRACGSQVWVSASEQLGEGEGGLGLLQGCSGPLVPGGPHGFPASHMEAGLRVPGPSCSELGSQASPHAHPTSSQHREQNPGLLSQSGEPLQPLTPPASSHPRPGGLPAAAPGPLHWVLFQLPTFSLTHISLFLVDAHFQRRLPEGPVSDAPTTNDCRFAGAGMGVRAAVPEGTEPENCGLDEGHVRVCRPSCAPATEPPCPRWGPSHKPRCGLLPRSAVLLQWAAGRWEGVLCLPAWEPRASEEPGVWTS